MKLVPLAWAALCRNWIETALTLLALTVAFTLFGAMVALNTAYEDAIDANPLDSLEVSCRFGCKHGMPYGYREQIARIPGVVAVGGRAGLGGYHGELSKRLRVNFYDASYRAAYSEFQLIFDDAQWQALQSTRDGLYFSRTAADRWQVKAGDTFSLSTNSPVRADADTTWIFKVLGVVSDFPHAGQGPLPMIYGNYQYLDESRLLTERGRADGFRILVADPAKGRATCRQIDATYLNSDVPTRSAPVHDDFEQTVDASLNMRWISLGVAVAGLCMIFFLYSNALSESVRERLPEFGMLMTLGYSNPRLAALVMLEAAIPAVLGAFIGTGVAWWIDIEITAAAREAHLEILQISMPAAEVAVTLVIALFTALVIALLSAIDPLKRLTRADLAAVMARR